MTDLPYILTAPFLHWSWSHIEGSSIPLLVLGFLAVYRSIPKFIGVTAVVIVTSGLAIWLFSPTRSYTDGASGVIFGYFGYVIVRGFFNHNKIDIVLGVVMMVYYFPIFSVLFPAPHLSYQGHIGGRWAASSAGGCSAPGLRLLRLAGPAATGADEIAVPATTSPLGYIEAELGALKKEIESSRRSLNELSDE